jgi:hypothetical protein
VVGIGQNEEHVLQEREVVRLEEAVRGLLKLPPQQFKLIMDSIVWATKHTMRDIGDLGLMLAAA